MGRGLITNRKAGEHSTTISLSMLTALIIVVAAAVLYFIFFSQTGSGMEEARNKGFCQMVMKTRHSVNPIEIIPWGDPRIGPAITGTSMFYVSPACGNMYTAPCNSTADCQSRIWDNIKECRKMQEAEPETSRPCLTDLEVSDNPVTPIGNADLCKENPNICGTGADCVSAAFGTTGVSNSIIDYKQCPQEGSSIAMKYDKSTIEVICQGPCG